MTGTEKNFQLLILVDMLVGSDDIFEEEIRKQVQLAIEEADIYNFCG